jgi:hypothetical protein
MAREYIMDNQWEGPFYQVKDINIQHLSIEKRGKYNKDGGYYPVTIKAVFTAKIYDIVLMGGTRYKEDKAYSKNLTWRIELNKDDYGKKTWSYYAGWGVIKRDY